MGQDREKEFEREVAVWCLIGAVVTILVWVVF
jgi:hypothetical protein